MRVQVPGSSSVPLSSFATALRVNALRSRPQRFKACACAWRDESIGESDSPVRTAADATSRLLVDLGTVLFQQQCSAWQRAGKAWTSRRKIEGAIRYFLKGLRVGQRPIFDGICSYGGHLLYGNLGETGVSNKRNGLPVDIAGNTLTGSRVDDAQPPFLLRWSPDFYARHAPDVFDYDAATNRLSLRPAHCERPPWKAAQHHRQKNAKASWLYCDACHIRLFGK